jgi:class 3 adenylate cyclase
MWKRIMPDLPSGTVTFLFTDIEGSTALWKRDRQAMVIAADGPGRAAAGAPRVAVVPAGTPVQKVIEVVLN